ncbi:MAG: HlyD family efflux transporter periplasmic adaptor subunit, partial [Lachnospiraceae bacterium]|nr:HlyD family efflux transporter periplasmic adaptor subunit [Lachnospiraceae bacterium]
MEIKMSKKKLALTAALIVATVTIGKVAMSASAVTKVNSYAVSTGSIEKITEINGNVVSDEIASKYSEIGGRVAGVKFKVGDYVKKGDTIISYDNEDLDRKIELADYSMKESFGGYDNVIQAGGRSAGLYYEAKKTLQNLDGQIAETQTAIDDLSRRLTAKRASIADYGAKLQISVVDWSDQPTSDEYMNLQKLLASNSYDQQFDPEILQMQEQIDALQVQLTSYRELKSQMVSQKASSYSGLITDGTKEQIEAAKAANEISTKEVIDRMEEAKKGVKADFAGVLTEIGVSENETVSEGAFLFTIESTENVVIRINVNKYDILDIEVGQPTACTIKGKDYTGKISRIEHMTGRDESANVGVEVRLDEPDENIILGLETKVKVTTASLEDVITIPMDALCMDDNDE